jgi:hypothetical protein
MIHSL